MNWVIEWNCARERVSWVWLGGRVTHLFIVNGANLGVAPTSDNSLVQQAGDLEATWSY